MFNRKKIVFIRVPKFIFSKKIDLTDLWSHVYGVFTTIGLIITIVFTYSTYKSEDNENIVIVIKTLGLSVIVLSIVFISASLYYLRRLQRLRKVRTEYQLVKNKLDRQYLVNHYQSECIHNITHYHRNIDTRLRQFLLEPDKYNEKECEEIVERFDYYLIILTSNLQNYFSFVTNDNCSVTIKKIDENKEYVRAFFRDPINFNKRKKSDFSYQNNKYLISQNSALKIIMDTQLSNTYFYDNNLKELYDNHNYDNCNSNWYKLYNATLVVPISMLISVNNRDVLGFLTIDNRKGDLATDINKEFLFGIADLLYGIFIMYSKFITLASSKIKNNERIKAFNMGSTS